jgi:hypothetical protein
MRNLEDIKKGTKVWMGRHGDRDEGIWEVERITSSQFILTRASYAGKVRIRRESGFEVGGHMFCFKITDIASPEEVTAYEAKEAREQAEYERQRAEEKALKEKTQQLSDLFKDGAYVTYESYHPGFAVKLSGLTEEQVKTLAELVKNLRQ